jgi:hypothetical protein
MSHVVKTDPVCIRCGGASIVGAAEGVTPCPVCRPAPKKKDTVTDAVNPDYYKKNPSGVECIQVAQHTSFCIGNAMKYLWRAGLKGSETEIKDLRKAAWYIHQEIERLGGGKNPLKDQETITP